MREEILAYKRERILEEAVKLFYERGFTGTTLDDIADVHLGALAIGGMISWAYTWHRPEGRLALDEMCERMADLALQMVGARTRVAAELPASAPA